MPVLKTSEPEVLDTPRLRRKNLKHVEAVINEELKPVSSRPQKASKPDNLWGRHSAVRLSTLLGCLSIMVLCPLVVAIFWASCDSFNGDLMKTIRNLRNFKAFLPEPSLTGFLLYGGWVLFQGLLYQFLPSEISKGQTTPAGFILSYKTNGLRAWFLSHAIFFYGAVRYNLFSPTIIYDNWGSIMIATNVYAWILAGFVYAKAHLFPSHSADRKFSGSWLYDFYMGVEFNPRLGKLWDFKLFHNGRPGIIGWTLINASFAAAQLRKHEVITNSMALVNVLQAVYVLDFFIHEDWYLKTIDIAHDHFGFMLSFGDSVWLPFMYTLQARYLVENPVVLSQLQVWSIFALGLGGYLIFRLANNQKDLVRRTRGKCMIWSKPAQFILAKYKSADGKEHESILLTSGFWGLSRHFNYLGDLMLSSAFCLTCGTQFILPYFYIIYMGILLLHRINRDQDRCQGKYGAYYEEYCRRVPYKLIPYIF